MDAAINLIVPQIDRIGIDETITEGNDDGYIYKGVIFEDLENARISAKAFEALVYNTDETAHDLYETTLKIINTADLKPLGGAYDLDLNLKMIPDFTRKLTGLPYMNGNDHFVSPDKFETSCPHKNPLHHRSVEDGLISCDAHRLNVYVKIMKWYSEYKPKITKVWDEEINEALPEVRGDMANRWFYKLISRVLNYLPLSPYTIMEKYRFGVERDYDKDRLTRNAYYFDYRSGMWQNERPQYTSYKTGIAKIDALHRMRDQIETQQPVLVEYLQPFITLMKDIQDGSTIDISDIIKAYYSGLSNYSHQFFNLFSGKWEHRTNNEIFAAPTVRNTFKGPHEHFDIDYFLSIIVEINIMNEADGE
jgi:hypothetical protein